MEIPKEITKIAGILADADFEVYLVGGCVRDLLLHVQPKDWDIATNASPEEIQTLFPDSVYENDFGTVGVKTRKEKKGEDGKKREIIEVVEITPYRLESKYSDKRHPDEVCFTRNLKDDLRRRDFTINAMAMRIKHGAPVYQTGRRSTKHEIISLREPEGSSEPRTAKPKTQNYKQADTKDQGLKTKDYDIVDLFEGQKDLKNKVIRAVGAPGERFDEDALRMLRVVRFAAQLGFTIEKETSEAVKSKAGLLTFIAKERIRDEFVKTIMSDRARQGIELAQRLGLLKHILPELEEGIGIDQRKAHKHPVWEHNLGALEHAVSKKWSLEIRLAALLHDVGKPASRRFDKEKNTYTFYGHEVVGAKMSVKALSRLKFPKKTIELVAKFVRYHMFLTDTDQITLSAVRRTVRNVGPEHVWDLMKVRFCDRIGMGRPKEEPYRLRKYESMIEEAMRAPLSVTMLKIDGEGVMDLLHVKPGPKIGNILHIVFEEVLDDSSKNTKKWLKTRILELGELGETALEKLGKEAKNTKEKAEDAEIKEIRKKWWVK